MRGLVMEVKGSTLIVLTPKGKYLRIKNPGNTAIGDHVSYETSAIQTWMPRQALALAASLLLVCTAGLGAYGYSQPFGIVTVDFNPSIALTYNWFEQLIDVEALTPDAETLLPTAMALRNRPVTEAVSALVKAAGDAGYLPPDADPVVFIAVSDKTSAQRAAGVITQLESQIREMPEAYETVLLTGNAAAFAHTRKNHASPVEKLVESALETEPEVTATPSGKTLKQIIRELKEKETRRLPDVSAPGKPSQPSTPSSDSNSAKPDTAPSKNGPPSDKAPEDDPDKDSSPDKPGPPDTPGKSDANAPDHPGQGNGTKKN